jgi:transcriptional regulator with XRE-family HTH domain
MTSTGATSGLAATLGQNIRLARHASRLTQRELALRMNWRKTDTQAVSDWERGVRRPSDEALIVLAGVFKRDLAWFYAQHEEQDEAA